MQRIVYGLQYISSSLCSSIAQPTALCILDYAHIYCTSLIKYLSVNVNAYNSSQSIS